MLSCPMVMCKIRKKKTIDGEIEFKSKNGGSGDPANPQGCPVCSLYPPVRYLRHVPLLSLPDIHYIDEIKALDGIYFVL